MEIPIPEPEKGPDRTERAVFAWLQEKTGWTDNVLRQVLADQDMEDAVSGYCYAGDEPSDLVTAARETHKRLFPKARATRTQHERAIHRPTRSEFDRAEVFSLQLGRLAKKQVTRYRRECLNDKILSRDEALQVLNSELCARANLDELNEHDVPLAPHTAHLINQDIHRSVSGRNHHQFRAMLDVSWPKARKRIEARGHLAYLNLADGLLPLYWAENSMSTEHAIIVWPHSILGQLREVSLKLEKDFPWRAASAAWFVLTGEAPLVFPATASTSRMFEDDFSYYQITISAQPWVDPDTVLDLFDRQRAQIKVSGKREVGEKALAFMKFFLRREWNRDDPHVLEKIRNEWNQVQCKDRPDLHYSASALRTALPRIRAMIMFQEDARPRRIEHASPPPQPEQKPRKSPTVSRKKR